MIATEFEFDGVSSSVFGLYICSFDGAKNGTGTLGNEITVNTVKSPNSNRWIHSESVYETPLTFTFQVFKYDCKSGSEPIEARELSRIMRWLVRNDGYHYLRFKQTGWDNVFYHCTLKLQKQEIAGKIYGFEIEATCDAPWGFSELKEYVINSSGTNSFHLYNYSDEDGTLLPELVKIEILRESDDEETCDLSITNNFNPDGDENKTVTNLVEINKCKPGEIIYLDKNKNIYSEDATHTTLPDDFNYHFLELYCDLSNGKNTISANHKCNITIQWREVRKGVC